MTAIWAGVVLTAYLTLTGVTLVSGASRVSPSALAIHFVLLALVAACTWWKVIPAWLRNWMPVIALPVLYAEAPSIIAAAGHLTMRDPVILGVEHLLFGSPSADLARAWPSRALSELLHASYLSYYAIVVSMPAVLEYGGRRRDFSRSVFALMLTFVLCLLIFTAFPVEGPRYRAVADAPHGPIRAATLWLLANGSSRGTAFPSSHVAVAVTQAILAVRFYGLRGLWLAALTLLLAIGAVYGGFHYAVDTIAGAALGVAATTLALRITAERAAPQANATAPT